MPEPRGYQPDGDSLEDSRRPSHGQSNTAVAQLFARLSQEIDDVKPPNCIHFVVDFLCKHYPEHLHGFASIWNADPELERERQEVVNFFKAHKISTQISAHFTNAGYDTLETLTTLSADALVDVEAFNNVKWLPGHKVRLQQIFTDITSRIRDYKQQRQAASGSYYMVPQQGIPPGYQFPPGAQNQQPPSPTSGAYASATASQFHSQPTTYSLGDPRQSVPVHMNPGAPPTQALGPPLTQSASQTGSQNAIGYPAASQKPSYFGPPAQQLQPPALRLQSMSRQA